MPPPPLQYQSFPTFLILEVLLFVQRLLILRYSISEVVKKALLGPVTTSTMSASSRHTPTNSRHTASNDPTLPLAPRRKKTNRRRRCRQAPPPDPWTEPWPEPEAWPSILNHPWTNLPPPTWEDDTLEQFTPWELSQLRNNRHTR